MIPLREVVLVLSLLIPFCLLIVGGVGICIRLWERKL